MCVIARGVCAYEECREEQSTTEQSTSEVDAIRHGSMDGSELSTKKIKEFGSLLLTLSNVVSVCSNLSFLLTEPCCVLIHDGTIKTFI